MDLLQSLITNVWSIFLVVLFFGGSIFVHELGHFLAARWRGVHVERFSIGFGPKIFSWLGKDGVEYRLSWLPLGGYVALPQLADMRGVEGESATDFSRLPPITYSTKVIVFVAGAVFNIIFAFFLACIVWLVGEPTRTTISTSVARVIPTLTDVNGQEVPSPASAAGLQTGDIILKVDGHSVQWFGEIVEQLALSSGWNQEGQRQTIFTIKRGSQITDLTVLPILSGPEKTRMVGFSPGTKLLIREVAAGSAAEKAGLQPGDEIIQVNQRRVLEPDQLTKALREKPDGLVNVTVLRGTEDKTIAVLRTETSTDGAAIGLSLQQGVIFTHPKPWEQIGGNIAKTFRTLGVLINPRSDIGVSHLSGPIGIIGSFFDLAKAGLPFALWFTILVNVNLAVFNLLPIPVLDGGHIFFATIGKLRGRNLPADFIATTQSVFIVLLFSMILYVSFFDVRRRVRDFHEDKAEVAAPAAPVVEPAPAK